MSRQEAIEQYRAALRLGQKTVKDLRAQGKPPYPLVLDKLIDDAQVAGRVDLGVIEIPTELIVGTKTVGRTSAFAANFMPLLSENSEFAVKWTELCAAHLGDEGIRDPIRCYEYLGKFYVQEGNKRVSVLKSYGAPTIPGYVTRIVPNWSDDPAIRCYYEFLQFYRLSGVYRITFRRPGGYAKLQAALGFEADHVWTPQERQSFLSGVTYFQDAFRKLRGDELGVTLGEALLVWLKVYPFSDLKRSSSAELLRSLSAVWADVKVLEHPDPISVSTDPREQEKGVLTKLVGAVFPAHVSVAFIYPDTPESSSWVYAHDQGRRHLEEALGDRVSVRVYCLAEPGDSGDSVMEQAVADGADVLFATAPPLIGACRRAAARHPEVKILNCSVAMPYTGVRTYYSRIFEGKFISGAIAGAMAGDDRIGYVASYPIFGVPASINAFALGAQLTNPRARIFLRWSCCEADPMAALTAQGVSVVSNRDTPLPDSLGSGWGLCQVLPQGGYRPLASPVWRWGVFYEKLVRSVLEGGWDELSSKDGARAVNYWWGLRTGVVDVSLSPELPDGPRHLAEILRQSILDSSLYPFHRLIRDQAGTVRNDGNRWFTSEEILHMDWLCQGVEGTIPSFDQILPRSQAIVRLQGVYRDQIPPEKEGTLL